jgi:hypothetical protein
VSRERAETKEPCGCRTIRTPGGPTEGDELMWLPCGNQHKMPYITPRTGVHSVKHRRHEITAILELANDLHRDDPNTLQTLALLRNGHPGSHPPTTPDTLYPDPTGEWAITPDQAINLGKLYNNCLKRAYDILAEADHIRRQMAPRPDPTTPDPDTWCRNCLPHAHCAPRTKDGGQYCAWCRDIQQIWGWLPPKHIVDMHHAGERNRLTLELQAYAKQNKKHRKK